MENEFSLYGRINYNGGPLMNSDRHAMIYCRNFEGRRSFVTVLGHIWALTHDAWYQQMILGGIRSTAGVVPGNCVTYVEVADLLKESASAGGVNRAGNDALGKTLAAARSQYENGDLKGAAATLDTFLKQAQDQMFCKSAAGACADSGAALAKLYVKGLELSNWMKGN
jgi:hypothetical protein